MSDVTQSPDAFTTTSTVCTIAPASSRAVNETLAPGSLVPRHASVVSRVRVCAVGFVHVTTGSTVSITNVCGPSSAVFPAPSRARPSSA